MKSQAKHQLKEPPNSTCSFLSVPVGNLHSAPRLVAIHTPNSPYTQWQVTVNEILYLVPTGRTPSTPVMQALRISIFSNWFSRWLCLFGDEMLDVDCECFCFDFVPSQGQRTSTLSCLLAGGNDNDIAEWSESMATPPLKISAPAGGRRNPFQVLMISVKTAFH